MELPSRGAMKLMQIVRTIVGQSGVLRVTPAILDRVEFRRVGREVFHLQARVSFEELLHLPAAMNFEVVPQHGHRSTMMPEKLLEELDQFLLTKRSVQMEPCHPAQAVSSWRDRQRTDDRRVTIVPRAWGND